MQDYLHRKNLRNFIVKRNAGARHKGQKRPPPDDGSKTLTGIRKRRSDSDENDENLNVYAERGRPTLFNYSNVPITEVPHITTILPSITVKPKFKPLPLLQIIKKNDLPKDYPEDYVNQGDNRYLNKGVKNFRSLSEIKEDGDEYDVFRTERMAGTKRAFQMPKLNGPGFVFPTGYMSNRGKGSASTRKSGPGFVFPSSVPVSEAQDKPMDTATEAITNVQPKNEDDEDVTNINAGDFPVSPNQPLTNARLAESEQTTSESSIGSSHENTSHENTSHENSVENTTNQSSSENTTNENTSESTTNESSPESTTNDNSLESITNENSVENTNYDNALENTPYESSVENTSSDNSLENSSHETSTERTSNESSIENPTVTSVEVNTEEISGNPTPAADLNESSENSKTVNDNVKSETEAQQTETENTKARDHSTSKSANADENPEVSSSKAKESDGENVPPDNRSFSSGENTFSEGEATKANEVTMHYVGNVLSGLEDKGLYDVNGNEITDEVLLQMMSEATKIYNEATSSVQISDLTFTNFDMANVGYELENIEEDKSREQDRTSEETTEDEEMVSILKAVTEILDSATEPLPLEQTSLPNEEPNEVPNEVNAEFETNLPDSNSNKENETNEPTINPEISQIIDDSSNIVKDVSVSGIDINNQVNSALLGVAMKNAKPVTGENFLSAGNTDSTDLHTGKLEKTISSETEEVGGSNNMDQLSVGSNIKSSVFPKITEEMEIATVNDHALKLESTESHESLESESETKAGGLNGKQNTEEGNLITNEDIQSGYTHKSEKENSEEELQSTRDTFSANEFEEKGKTSADNQQQAKTASTESTEESELLKAEEKLNKDFGAGNESESTSEKSSDNSNETSSEESAESQENKEETKKIESEWATQNLIATLLTESVQILKSATAPVKLPEDLINFTQFMPYHAGGETETNSNEAERTQAENTEAENTQAENAQAENTQTENTEAENTQAENTQAENTQAENTQIENTQAENTQAENTASEPENKSELLSTMETQMHEETSADNIISTYGTTTELVSSALSMSEVGESESTATSSAYSTTEMSANSENIGTSSLTVLSENSEGPVSAITTESTVIAEETKTSSANLAETSSASIIETSSIASTESNTEQHTETSPHGAEEHTESEVTTAEGKITSAITSSEELPKTTVGQSESEVAATEGSISSAIITTSEELVKTTVEQSQSEVTAAEGKVTSAITTTEELAKTTVAQSESEVAATEGKITSVITTTEELAKTNVEQPNSQSVAESTAINSITPSVSAESISEQARVEAGTTESVASTSIETPAMAEVQTNSPETSATAMEETSAELTHTNAPASSAFGTSIAGTTEQEIGSKPATAISGTSAIEETAAENQAEIEHSTTALHGGETNGGSGKYSTSNENELLDYGYHDGVSLKQIVTESHKIYATAIEKVSIPEELLIKTGGPQKSITDNVAAATETDNNEMPELTTESMNVLNRDKVTLQEILTDANQVLQSAMSTVHIPEELKYISTPVFTKSHDSTETMENFTEINEPQLDVLKQEHQSIGSMLTEATHVYNSATAKVTVPNELRVTKLHMEEQTEPKESEQESNNSLSSNGNKETATEEEDEKKANEASANELNNLEPTERDLIANMLTEANIIFKNAMNKVEIPDELRVSNNAGMNYTGHPAGDQNNSEEPNESESKTTSDTKEEFDSELKQDNGVSEPSAVTINVLTHMERVEKDNASIASILTRATKIFNSATASVTIPKQFHVISTTSFDESDEGAHSLTNGETEETSLRNEEEAITKVSKTDLASSLESVTSEKGASETHVMSKTTGETKEESDFELKQESGGSESPAVTINVLTHMEPVERDNASIASILTRATKIFNSATASVTMPKDFHAMTTPLDETDQRAHSAAGGETEESTMKSEEEGNSKVTKIDLVSNLESVTTEKVAGGTHTISSGGAESETKGGEIKNGVTENETHVMPTKATDDLELKPSNGVSEPPAVTINVLTHMGPVERDNASIASILTRATKIFISATASVTIPNNFHAMTTPLGETDEGAHPVAGGETGRTEGASSEETFQHEITTLFEPDNLLGNGDTDESKTKRTVENNATASSAENQISSAENPTSHVIESTNSNPSNEVRSKPSVVTETAPTEGFESSQRTEVPLTASFSVPGGQATFDENDEVILGSVLATPFHEFGDAEASAYVTFQQEDYDGMDSAKLTIATISKDLLESTAGTDSSAGSTNLESGGTFVSSTKEETENGATNSVAQTTEETNMNAASAEVTTANTLTEVTKIESSATAHNPISEDFAIATGATEAANINVNATAQVEIHTQSGGSAETSGQAQELGTGTTFLSNAETSTSELVPADVTAKVQQNMNANLSKENSSVTTPQQTTNAEETGTKTEEKEMSVATTESESSLEPTPIASVSGQQESITNQGTNEETSISTSLPKETNISNTANSPERVSVTTNEESSNSPAVTDVEMETNKAGTELLLHHHSIDEILQKENMTLISLLSEATRLYENATAEVTIPHGTRSPSEEASNKEHVMASPGIVLNNEDKTSSSERISDKDHITSSSEGLSSKEDITGTSEKVSNKEDIVSSTESISNKEEIGGSTEIVSEIGNTGSSENVSNRENMVGNTENISNNMIGTSESISNKEDLISSSEQVSNKENIGSSENVSSKEDVGSSEHVSNKEDVIGSTENISSKENIIGSSETVSNKEDVIGSTENVSNKEDIIGSSENVSNKEGVVGSTENVSTKEDIMGGTENVSNKENVIGSTENVSIKENVMSSTENVLNKEDNIASTENVSNKENVIGSTETVSNKEDNFGSTENVSNKENVIGSAENVSSKEGVSGSSENVSNKEDVIGSTENISNKDVMMGSSENVSSKEGVAGSTENSANNEVITSEKVSDKENIGSSESSSNKEDVTNSVATGVSDYDYVSNKDDVIASSVADKENIISSSATISNKETLAGSTESVSNKEDVNGNTETISNKEFDIGSSETILGKGSVWEDQTNSINLKHQGSHQPYTEENFLRENSTLASMLTEASNLYERATSKVSLPAQLTLSGNAVNIPVHNAGTTTELANAESLQTSGISVNTSEVKSQEDTTISVINTESTAAHENTPGNVSIATDRPTQSTEFLSSNTSNQSPITTESQVPQFPSILPDARKVFEATPTTAVAPEGLTKLEDGNGGSKSTHVGETAVNGTAELGQTRTVEAVTDQTTLVGQQSSSGSVPIFDEDDVQKTFPEIKRTLSSDRADQTSANQEIANNHITEQTNGTPTTAMSLIAESNTVLTPSPGAVTESQSAQNVDTQSVSEIATTFASSTPFVQPSDLATLTENTASNNTQETSQEIRTFGDLTQTQQINNEVNTQPASESGQTTAAELSSQSVSSAVPETAVLQPSESTPAIGLILKTETTNNLITQESSNSVAALGTSELVVPLTLAVSTNTEAVTDAHVGSNGQSSSITESNQLASIGSAESVPTANARISDFGEKTESSKTGSEMISEKGFSAEMLSGENVSTNVGVITSSLPLSTEEANVRPQGRSEGIKTEISTETTPQLPANHVASEVYQDVLMNARHSESTTETTGGTGAFKTETLPSNVDLMNTTAGALPETQTTVIGENALGSGSVTTLSNESLEVAANMPTSSQFAESLNLNTSSTTMQYSGMETPSNDNIGTRNTTGGSPEITQSSYQNIQPSEVATTASTSMGTHKITGWVMAEAPAENASSISPRNCTDNNFIGFVTIVEKTTHDKLFHKNVTPSCSETTAEGPPSELVPMSNNFQEGNGESSTVRHSSTTTEAPTHLNLCIEDETDAQPTCKTQTAGKLCVDEALLLTLFENATTMPALGNSKKHKLHHASTETVKCVSSSESLQQTASNKQPEAVKVPARQIADGESDDDVCPQGGELTKSTVNGVEGNNDVAHADAANADNSVSKEQIAQVTINGGEGCDADITESVTTCGPPHKHTVAADNDLALNVTELNGANIKPHHGKHHNSNTNSQLSVEPESNMAHGNMDTFEKSADTATQQESEAVGTTEPETTMEVNSENSPVQETPSDENIDSAMGTKTFENNDNDITPQSQQENSENQLATPEMNATIEPDEVDAICEQDRPKTTTAVCADIHKHTASTGKELKPSQEVNAANIKPHLKKHTTKCTRHTKKCRKPTKCTKPHHKHTVSTVQENTETTVEVNGANIDPRKHKKKKKCHRKCKKKCKHKTRSEKQDLKKDVANFPSTEYSTLITESAKQSDTSSSFESSDDLTDAVVEVRKSMLRSSICSSSGHKHAMGANRNNNIESAKVTKVKLCTSSATTSKHKICSSTVHKHVEKATKLPKMELNTHLAAQQNVSTNLICAKQTTRLPTEKCSSKIHKHTLSTIADVQVVSDEINGEDIKLSSLKTADLAVNDMRREENVIQVRKYAAEPAEPMNDVAAPPERREDDECTTENECTTECNSAVYKPDLETNVAFWNAVLAKVGPTQKGCVAETKSQCGCSSKHTESDCVDNITVEFTESTCTTSQCADTSTTQSQCAESSTTETECTEPSTSRCPETTTSECTTQRQCTTECTTERPCATECTTESKCADATTTESPCANTSTAKCPSSDLAKKSEYWKAYYSAMVKNGEGLCDTSTTECQTEFDSIAGLPVNSADYKVYAGVVQNGSQIPTESPCGATTTAGCHVPLIQSNFNVYAGVIQNGSQLDAGENIDTGKCAGTTTTECQDTETSPETTCSESTTKPCDETTRGQVDMNNFIHDLVTFLEKYTVKPAQETTNQALQERSIGYYEKFFRPFKEKNKGHEIPSTYNKRREIAIPAKIVQVRDFGRSKGRLAKIQRDNVQEAQDISKVAASVTMYSPLYSEEIRNVPDTNLRNTAHKTADIGKVTKPAAKISSISPEAFKSKIATASAAIEHKKTAPPEIANVPEDSLSTVNILTNCTPSLLPTVLGALGPASVTIRNSARSASSPAYSNSTKQDETSVNKLDSTTGHLTTNGKENATLTSTTHIYIDLPVYYPNSSETPESFEKFYTTESKDILDMDEELTELTIDISQFRTMHARDFEMITEYPPTTTDNTSSTYDEVAKTNSSKPQSMQTSTVKESSTNAGSCTTTVSPSSASGSCVQKSFAEFRQSRNKEELNSEGKSVKEDSVNREHEKEHGTLKTERTKFEGTTTSPSSSLKLFTTEQSEAKRQSPKGVSSTVVTSSVGLSDSRLSSHVDKRGRDDKNDAHSTHPMSTATSNAHEVRYELTTFPSVLARIKEDEEEESSSNAQGANGKTLLSCSNEPNRTTGTEESNLFLDLGNVTEQSSANLSNRTYGQQQWNKLNGTSLCSLDEVIKVIKEKIDQKDFPGNLEADKCPGYLNIKDGIILANETVPTLKLNTLRSHRFGEEKYRTKRETIRHSDIEKVLYEDTDLQDSEYHTYALPGMRVVLSCDSTDIFENGQGQKYTWSFTDGRQIPRENDVKKYEGTYTIESVSPEDSGNYTCASFSLTGEKLKDIEHELTVVAMPTYSINKHMVYEVNGLCELKDVDIMSLYMPNIMRTMLCGVYSKVCRVQIHEPHCLERNDKSMISVRMSLTINPLNDIMPSLNLTTCNINCQKKMYGKITAVVVENVEMLEKAPVISRLNSRKVQFYPTEAEMKSQNNQEVTEPSQLVITCPAGFGLRKQDRICAACDRNTYNTGDKSKCKLCPPGQFTPMLGSKACLTCTTPLQDPACIRVFFYNSRTLRMYVGFSFSTALLIILLIMCYANSKKSKSMTTMDKYQKNYRLDPSRRKRREEAGREGEPLLQGGRSWDRRSNKPPPEPPPPDF